MSLTIEVNNSNQKFLLLLQITSEEGQHFFDEDKRHQKIMGSIFLRGIFCFSLVSHLFCSLTSGGFFFPIFFKNIIFIFLRVQNLRHTVLKELSIYRESKELLVTYEHVKCLSCVVLLISCHAIQNFQSVKLIAVEICH